LRLTKKKITLKLIINPLNKTRQNSFVN